MYILSKHTISHRGYSLIQMAIAMIVLGLLVTPFANLYMLDQKNQKIITTTKNRDAIITAIQDYRDKYGIYPRPAPMSVGRNDASYGHALSAATANAIAAGTCGMGASNICAQTSTRSTLTPAQKRVIVGAVPFREIQVIEDQTVDGYGSKFVYAITDSLTETLTFSEMNGGIDILDQSKSVLSPAASASFVVLSPGEDKVGGYTKEGVLQIPCTGPGRDVQNCNIGFQTGAANPNNATFVSTLTSSTPGANHFDDLVSYYTKNVDPLWRKTKINEDNIQAIPSGNVGLGTQTPDKKVSVTSISATPARPSLKVTGANGNDGKLVVQNICDTNGNNCFDPSVIGGSTAAGKGMDCGTGKSMLGIRNSGPDCNDLTNIPPLQCDPSGANPVLIGTTKNSDGTVSAKCGPRPGKSCAATTKTLCATNDISLLDTPSGSKQGPFSAGDCRTLNNWTCNDGTWTAGTYSGNCKFTVPAPTTTITSCGGGYGSTTYTTTKQKNCDGTTTVTTDQATKCICVGGTTTATKACNTFSGYGNYSGNASQTTTYTPPSCKTSTSAWDMTQCKCSVPSSTTQTVSAGTCATGYSGTITQDQVFDTASCSWKNSGAVKNTCTCTVPSPSTKSVFSNGCAAGFTGNVEQVQKFDAASCSWKNSGSPIQHCTCNTASSTRSADHVCSDAICESSDSGSPDIFTTTVDPTTCKKSESLTTPGSCKSNTFYWRAVTGASPGTGAPPSPNFIGLTTCSCSQFKSGVTSSCYQQGDSNYARYNCTCQK